MLGTEKAAMRNRGAWRTLCSLLILAVGPQAGVRAQGAKSYDHSGALPSSSSRVLFDRGAFFGAHAAMPRWNNGYLISREVETFEDGTANVRLYDRSGNRVGGAVIWFPGSQRVLIYSATATADGKILASGTAEKIDGSHASFIALTDRAGKLTDVIQTKGFVPVNICQAPDGSVWGFGGTGYDENSEPNPGDTLRRFNFRKGELSSYLPRSSFPKQLHPGPEVLAYIHCAGQEVVAYSSSAREYIEMKYENDSPRIYSAEVPSGLQLVGFAAISPDEVFGHFSRAGRDGLFSLSLNKAAGTAQWLPVEGTVGVHTKPGVIIGLWGSDGDKLVLSRAEDNAGAEALHWVTPPE